MRNRRAKIAFCLTFLPALSAFYTLPLKTESSQSNLKLETVFQKARVTVAVTDSGLGGLSVMAEAARKMKEARIFAAADLIFFNALFSSEGGYNSLKTRQEKIAVFDRALNSLEKKYRPDVILIGCNTLSVLYPDTPFAKQTKTPVVGIVDAGVDLIALNLASHSDSSVIIFGTPTTIAENTHKQRLIELGFAEQWVIVQSCPELESFIEKDCGGEETAMLISGCVAEAVEKIPQPRPPLLVSLNCTHYGYSLPLWEKAFEEAGIKPLAILNPNSRMADVLIRPELVNRYPDTVVHCRAVSMVEISPEMRASLGPWLQGVSPETAAALKNFELEPALFEWKSLVKR